MILLGSNSSATAPTPSGRNKAKTATFLTQEVPVKPTPRGGCH
ncbi:T9SS C-terminal target domain-containing protein [Escherichia phage IMM-001]|nr:T9SS C-terminal target domain-containing protein [Escherichia phage IMM-001]